MSDTFSLQEISLADRLERARRFRAAPRGPISQSVSPETKEDFALALLSHVVEYWNAFQSPTPFAHLSRKFNKTAARAKMSLREIVTDDPRFLARLTKRGGLIVMPQLEFLTFVEQRARLSPDLSPAQIIWNLWSAWGSPLA